MCELADVCVRMSVYQCMHHSMLVCWHRVGMCNVLKQVTATSLLPGISSAVHTQTHTNPISCLLVFPLKSWCYPSTNMHFSSSLLCHLPCCITGHISFTSVPHSWVYVSVQCVSCSHHSHSPELKEVFEKKNTPLFLLFSFFSYLFCLYFSNPPVLSFVLFFSSCFHSFHKSQSLDQVALTNVTILDGSGGGPNGSLAGSMGSVAVCLPSESSLTDSLHTSAVSLQWISFGNTRWIPIWTSSLSPILKYNPGPLPSTCWCCIIADCYLVLLLRWKCNGLLSYWHFVVIITAHKLPAVWLVVLKESQLSMLHCMFCFAGVYCYL